MRFSFVDSAQARGAFNDTTAPPALGKLGE